MIFEPISKITVALAITVSTNTRGGCNHDGYDALDDDDDAFDYDSELVFMFAIVIVMMQRGEPLALIAKNSDHGKLSELSESSESCRNGISNSVNKWPLLNG